MTSWQEFVLTEGRGARADLLAAVVGQPAAAIARLRAATPAGTAVRARLTAACFPDLFRRWQGRLPSDREWPRPRRWHGSYEWHAPELALLARLVGRVGVDAIAATLTKRLRSVTGDRAARRNRLAVQAAIQRLGLQASEVLGGLTVREAARRLGSLAIVQQAINAGRLRTFRVGRLHVIPVDAFEAFQATRDRPPAGWVRLASLMRPLGIKSDARLPEYAKLGQIPDTVFVRSQHLWYIAPTRARQILQDAREGRPLPWHGQPNPWNLKATWQKWRARGHRRCLTCRSIWGRPAPPTFGAFARRYPTLTFAQKRHLTWRQGFTPRCRPGPRRLTRLRRALAYFGYSLVRIYAVTIPEAARLLGVPRAWVWARIREGVARPLRSHDPGEPLRLSAPALRALRAARGVERRGRPRGQWLGPHAAAARAGVSIATIENWRRRRRLGVRPGQRGRLYSVRTLERAARVYWTSQVRFKRATPPAWLQEAA